MKSAVGSLLMQEGLKYLEKNPEKNMGNMLKWAKKFPTSQENKEKIEMIENIWFEENNIWKDFMLKILRELHPNQVQKFIINYMINSGVVGMPKAEKLAKEHGCSIPWTILMDPTSACNLKCKGCWAENYKKADSMSYEELDRIIREGKELGIYMYIYSGGEPLMRKKDLIRLAEKHSDCMFLSFTNGTLIDEEFAKDVQRVGNLTFAISVEGIGEATDMRRGEGVYDRVIKAMDILKEHKIGFGFSTCYHSKNVDDVSSDEFIDLMIDKGAYFGWFFTYIPLGNGADLDLVATPEQREYMYHRLRELRSKKPLFLMDFWNDGEYVRGCIAGGRRYFHINAHGDVEPCAFVHYSNYNIHDVSLLEALKSPIFMQYQKYQPFNDNLLRPCPMFDNPDILRKMVHESGAKSTQPLDEESVDNLADKNNVFAEKWAPVASELWELNRKEAVLREKLKKHAVNQ